MPTPTSPPPLWSPGAGAPTAQAAAVELTTGLQRMLTHPLRTATTLPETGDVLAIGTVADLSQAGIPTTPLSPDGFRIARLPQHNRTLWIVAGGSPTGELYGVFRLLAWIAEDKPLPSHPIVDEPANKIRWVNQWDNLDGSIERGYAGRSIFFDAGHVRPDLTRAAEYARLLASVGINGVTVNNVNSDLRTLTPEMIAEFARIADVFRPWGVRLSLSVDLSSPQVVGGLKTFDPLDPSVQRWWQQTVDALYQKIPDFAGFVVKADSEGRSRPSCEYGRTPAEAANVLARALQPHSGIVLYRGFVYNHHLDWHDLKADRARAGYDNFHDLDGKFEPNVVVQIKHGPIDFQVREPVSPLFAALRHTAQAIELQITQEYTGQQRDMVFLVPMWKTALDTDMRVPNAAGIPQHTPVQEIVSGKSFHQPLGGFVGVANVGLDANWMHHPMALANLYGFGRLAWNPDLTSDAIVDEWTRQSFGNDPQVVSTIDRLQLESWRAYEDYTGPLGLGTLTDIIGVHFGPGIESAERNGWGQWIRADHEGIGMDRTVATGTGYIGQYPPQLAAEYESLETCPDDLLLFLHHVPYTHVLHPAKPSSSTSTTPTTRAPPSPPPTPPSGPSARAQNRPRRIRPRTPALHLSGRPRHRLARRRQRLVPPDLRHRRHAQPRRPPPQPHRGRGHDQRRLPTRRHPPLGDRLGQQGRRLPTLHRLHPVHETPTARRPLSHRRTVLRPPHRRLALRAPPERPLHRLLGRRRHPPPCSSPSPTGRPDQHPLHHLRAGAPSRRHPHPARHPGRPRARPRRLPRANPRHPIVPLSASHLPGQ